jgi:membrane protein YqaA with SNARE-associated domain
VSAVEDGIAHAFDHLVAPLGWVLVLIVWFTLPGRYTLCAKDGAYSIAGFHFSTVTDQFGRHSMIKYLIRKYTQKKS